MMLKDTKQQRHILILLKRMFSCNNNVIFLWLVFYSHKTQFIVSLVKNKTDFRNITGLEINKLREHRDSGLFQPSVFYSTGHRLRHCPIPRLLLLLHHPVGPALPVLFCGPASGGKKHLGKGRQRRMYPTSVKKRQLRSSAHKRKCLSSYLVVFKSCCHDTFPFWR